MYSHTKNDLGSADLMLYLGFSSNDYKSGLMGVGYKGMVCKHSGYNGYKSSLTVYR